MSNISEWSTDAAENNASPPDGAPENGTLVSDLNNIDRETMAAVRRWYNDAEWRDFNDNPTYVSATSFSVAVGSLYHVGQKLRITDSTQFETHAQRVQGNIITIAPPLLTNALARVEAGHLPDSYGAQFDSLGGVVAGFMTCVRSAPGIYGINHGLNLTNINYAVMVTTTGGSDTAGYSQAITGHITGKREDAFTVILRDTDNAEIDADFSIVLQVM